MTAIARVGDTNQAGGAIINGAGTVFINGIKVGLHTSSITPHGDGKHGSAKTTNGSPTVFAENKPVLKVGSGNDCGHSIAKGSPDVFVA